MAEQTLHLGARPNTGLLVHLITGADFLTTLKSTGGPWPAGAVVSLRLGATTWNATVTGTDAVFAADKAIADQIPADAPARLVVTHGASDQVLAIGRVVRYE